MFVTTDALDAVLRQSCGARRSARQVPKAMSKFVETFRLTVDDFPEAPYEEVQLMCFSPLVVWNCRFAEVVVSA